MTTLKKDRNPNVTNSPELQSKDSQMSLSEIPTFALDKKRKKQDQQRPIYFLAYKLPYDTHCAIK